MPWLAYPLAMLGLAAVPALAAIYFLRSRFRRRPVSSLMLWRQAPVGDSAARSRAYLVLAGTVGLTGLCLIGATARLWFGHLWPHRRRPHGYHLQQGADDGD